MALGDINGDEKLDLVFGNFQGQANQLLLSQPGGNYEASDLPSLWPDVGDRPATCSLALGDVNNDGWLDLVVGNAGSNELLLGKPDVGFEEVPSKLPGLEVGLTASFVAGGSCAGTRSIALGDVNGDEFLDLVMGMFDEPNRLLINKEGSFVDNPIPLVDSDRSTTSVALGDVNADRQLDLVVGNCREPNQLLLGTGDGFANISSNLPGGDQVTEAVALGDVDGDGLLDLVVSNSYSPNQLLLGTQSGGFGGAVDLPGYSEVSPEEGVLAGSVALGDVNRDGKLDLVSNRGIVLSKAFGEFADDVSDLPGKSSDTYALALGDVNGDDLVDVIEGNYGTANQLLLPRRAAGLSLLICPAAQRRTHTQSRLAM